ncbi:MAG: hypothetical protein V3U24_06115 [Candidatus Neomarinimicrobiota bacterium]
MGFVRLCEEDTTIQWLLEGDPSIRWQTLRDLEGADDQVVKRERHLVSETGWGARLLCNQEPSGQWGGGLYSPKWISTTYTMLLLRRLGLPPEHPQASRACALLLDRGVYPDGGINYFTTLKHSETCVTGMILAILAYFHFPDDRVDVLASYLLEQQMKDGGWNCQTYKGATHGSFHTTISVLEGLYEYEKFHPQRIQEIRETQSRGCEFLLAHRLFRSHRTGEIVNPAMTRFSFPPRWRYDILRALDYFQDCGAERNERLEDAIKVVRKRQKKGGRWLLQNRHPGRTFFEMEKAGEASRWNTLRALRILRWWGDS